QKLLRIRRRRAAWNQCQLLERLDDLERLFHLAALADEIRESVACAQTEQAMLLRVAQVAVDQKRALPELRKHDREIRCHRAAGGIAPCGSDRERALLAAEPTHEQLTAERPKRLRIGAERFVCG